MGVNKRGDGRRGKHGAGTYKRKSGPKKKHPGAPLVPGKRQKTCASEKAAWKRKIPSLFERGESMDAGAARMALYTTLKVTRRPRT